MILKYSNSNTNYLKCLCCFFFWLSRGFKAFKGKLNHTTQRSCRVVPIMWNQLYNVLCCSRKALSRQRKSTWWWWGDQLLQFSKQFFPILAWYWISAAQQLGGLLLCIFLFFIMQQITDGRCGLYKQTSWLFYFGIMLLRSVWFGIVWLKYARPSSSWTLPIPRALMHF